MREEPPPPPDFGSARCPRCNGTGCEECSYTGQAEFFSADPFRDIGESHQQPTSEDEELARIYREQREALEAIQRGEGGGARLGLADWVMEEVLVRLRRKEAELAAPGAAAIRAVRMLVKFGLKLEGRAWDSTEGAGK